MIRKERTMLSDDQCCLSSSHGKSTVAEHVLVLGIFLLLGILVFRGLIFRAGVVGHKWDWSIPPTKDQLSSMISFSTWNEQFLGFQMGYSISILPIQMMLGCLGLLGLDGEIISKSLLLLAVGLAGTSMYLAIQEIAVRHDNPIGFQKGKFRVTSLQIVSFTAAYYYALSPYLFNELIGGAYTQLISYSVAPLAFLFYHRFLKASKVEGKQLLLASLLLNVVAISLQRATILIGLMLFYTAPECRRGLFRFFLVILSSSLLGAYWVLPVLGQLQAIVGGLAYLSPKLMQFILEVHTPSLANAFLGTGYWTDFFLGAIPNAILPVWALAASAVVSIIFSGLLVRHKNRETLIWGLLAIVSVALASGTHSPLAHAILWLYDNVPIMALFRSPQHLMFAPTFSYAILLGVAIASITRIHRLTRRQTKLFLISTLLLSSLWIAPFYGGDLSGEVDVFQVPLDYQAIMDAVVQSKDFRILYIPMAASPRFEKTEYQSQNQGGDPTVIYSNPPAVVADFAVGSETRLFAGLLEELIVTGDSPEYISQMLAIANVKYIVLRKDLRPEHTPFAKDWNYSQVYANLKRIDNVKLLSEYKYASLWENQWVVPKIYVPRNVVYIAGNETALSTAIDLTRSNAFSAYVFSSQLRSEYQATLVQAASSILVHVGVDSIITNKGWRVCKEERGIYLCAQALSYPNATVTFSFSIPRDDYYKIYLTLSSSLGRPSLKFRVDDERWRRLDVMSDDPEVRQFEELLGGIEFLVKGKYTITIRNDDAASIASTVYLKGISLVSSKDQIDDRYPNLTYSRASPTSYVVRISSERPFLLVYSEAYNTGWTARIDQREVKEHIVSNVYANAWYVNMTGSFELDLEYEPQRLLNYGASISILALIASCLYVIISRRRLS